jgi:hypothetical protein
MICVVKRYNQSPRGRKECSERDEGPGTKQEEEAGQLEKYSMPKESA